MLKHMTRALIGATFVAVAVMASGATAGAQSYGEPDETLTISDSTLIPGAPFQVTGGGFMPDSPVEVIFNSTPTLLGVLTASATGTASGSFDVPANAAPGAHRVDMVGLDPDGNARVLSVSVTVAAAGAAATPARSSTTGSALAFTGTTTLTLVAIGALLLAGGVTVMQLRRRRSGVAG